MAARRYFQWLFGDRKKETRTIQGVEPDSTKMWLAIPEDALLKDIARYVDSVEISATTTDNCWCEWIVHPRDVNLPKGQRRIRPGNQHPLCPRHTKEGFLFGFMRYLDGNT